jgi:hypothetical protein
MKKQIESLSFDLRPKYECTTTLKGFKTHKVLTIIMYTPQVTQVTSLFKAKAKQFFYIGCGQLTPSMAIILSVHALHLGRVVNG